LQLKTGRLAASYFRDKFSVNILDDFRDAFRKWSDAGYMTVAGDQVTLSREGLMRVDQLLPAFFLAEHRGTRYT
jgi:oxygen-independent coproporphyrinogen-3 oxidase